MIIISQDKTMILNFENIEAIGIGNPLEENEGKFKILCDITSDNQYTMAEYETEERAKEVLKDIISRYEAIELCKREYSISNILGYTLGDYTPIYEMPEE